MVGLGLGLGSGIGNWVSVLGSGSNSFWNVVSLVGSGLSWFLIL